MSNYPAIIATTPLSFPVQRPIALSTDLNELYQVDLASVNKLQSTASKTVKGTRTDGARSNPKNNIVGDAKDAYGELFFENVWVVPEVVNVGNVYRDVVVQFYIYCSYKESTTIPLITHTDLDGIRFDPDILEMTAFLPRMEYLINVYVDSQGPSIINEAVYITTDTTNRDTPIVDIPIVGSRAILIGAEPNWQENVIERYEWKTEIETTYDGQEIRRCLRQYPRRFMEYTARLTKHQLQAIENLIYTFFEYVFVIPVWTNICHTVHPVYETDDVIVVDNTPIIDKLDKFVLWESFNKYTICESIEIDGKTLHLRNVVGENYHANTKVIPLLTGRLTENIAMSSYSSQARDFQFKFMFDQADYLPKAPPPVTYNGIELLVQQPNWRDSLSGSWANEQYILDDNYGRVAVIQHGRSNKSRSFTWLLKTYDEVRAVYELLDRLRGRQKRIFIATYNDDFFLASPYITGQSNIVVRSNNFEIMGLDDDHMYIMLRFIGRDYLIREITAYAELADNTVRLNLGSPINFSFTEADLFGIHWVKHYRLNEDSISLAWKSAGVVEVDTPFVERQP